MADAAPVVHIGENASELVALKLFEKIETAEAQPYRTRAQILDLYAECLLAVRDPVGRLNR
jgi:hypothetical protein